MKLSKPVQTLAGCIYIEKSSGQNVEEPAFLAFLKGREFLEIARVLLKIDYHL